MNASLTTPGSATPDLLGSPREVLQEILKLVFNITTPCIDLRQQRRREAGERPEHCIYEFHRYVHSTFGQLDSFTSMSVRVGSFA